MVTEEASSSNTTVILAAVMGGLILVIIIVAGLAYIFKRSNKVTDKVGGHIVAVESNYPCQVSEDDRDTHIVYDDLNKHGDGKDPQTHSDTGDHSARPLKRLH